MPTPTASPESPLRLSLRAQQARPSLILGINARAKALIAAGRDVVLFGAGEPDFPTAPHIRQATTAAMERGETKYTASNGTAELREAIVQKLKRDQSLSYAADEVIVTTGAKMALYELFQAVCNEGDEVVLFSPFWTSYAEIVALAGAKPVLVPTKEADGFVPDPELLRKALTSRTRVVLLNSPGNPTGAVFSAETLQAIARVLAPTGVLVVSDDIYEKIVFDGRQFSNIAQLSADWKARTVVINGVSKAYSMTGFRIGWAAGPKQVIAAMGRVQDQSTSGPAAFAQAGATAALNGPQGFVADMCAEFERRRNMIVEGLRSIPGVTCTSPGGAFYVLPSVAPFLGRRLEGRAIETAAALAEVLLEKFGVALVPGEPFGAPTHLRLSFATSMAEISRGLGRLREGLGELRG